MDLGLPTNFFGSGAQEAIKTSRLPVQVGNGGTAHAPLAQRHFSNASCFMTMKMFKHAAVKIPTDKSTKALARAI